MLFDEFLVPVIALLRDAAQIFILVVHAHQTVALLVAVDPGIEIHGGPDVVTLYVDAVFLGLQNIMNVILFSHQNF